MQILTLPADKAINANQVKLNISNQPKRQPFHHILSPKLVTPIATPPPPTPQNPPIVLTHQILPHSQLVILTTQLMILLTKLTQ